MGLPPPLAGHCAKIVAIHAAQIRPVEEGVSAADMVSLALAI